MVASFLVAGSGERIGKVISYIVIHRPVPAVNSEFFLLPNA